MLWDADGVLQHLPAGWEASMRPVVGHLVDDVEGFLAEAFEAERPALAGQARWVEVLPVLLERWGLADSYDDAIRVWLTIEPVVETQELVRSLRSHGVRCCLATNQDEHRGRHMHETFGYAELFDETFYSYELGVAKPDPTYFTAILDRLGVEPGGGAVRRRQRRQRRGGPVGGPAGRAVARRGRAAGAPRAAGPARPARVRVG